MKAHFNIFHFILLFWFSENLIRPCFGLEETGYQNVTGGNLMHTIRENEACGDPQHREGIHLASFRWQEIGVYFTITAFVLIAGLAKLGFHHIHWLSTRVPESCILIVLGVLLGLILYFTSATVPDETGCRVTFPRFTSQAFFLILLPPIILESAYSLHDRAFFDNVGTVLVFAVVGTLFNIFTIGPTLYGAGQVGALGQQLNISMTENFVFSSLISAVDPVAVLAIFQDLGVNKNLYFLVFGESLLNDGITVVVYNTVTVFASMNYIPPIQYFLAVLSFFIVVLGGMFIGTILGLLTAYTTRWTTDVRVVEPLALLGYAYLSYLTAELFHFSGIISATSDTIIFMFLGMVLVSDDHQWHTWFVIWTLAATLIYRFIGVFVLSAICNHYRINKIGVEEQFIIAYGGLRGAVAFSLVSSLDDSVATKDIQETTTLVVILFTVFVQGITLKPLVNLLDIKRRNVGKKSLNEEVNSAALDHIMAGVEEIVGQHGDFYLREVIKHYNEKYLKKWLVKPTNDFYLKRLFEKITLSEHYANLYGPVALIEDGMAPCIRRASRKGLPDEIFTGSCVGIKSKSIEPIFVTDVTPEESVQTRRKSRHSLFGRTSRVFSESAAEPERRDRRTLREAFKSNPYNKLHYKYNRNLVDEDDQEIDTYLERRQFNARRLSKLASGIESQRNSLYSDTGAGGGDTNLTNPSSNSPTKGIELWQNAMLLVERHRKRSMKMQGRASINTSEDMLEGRVFPCRSVSSGVNQHPFSVISENEELQSEMFPLVAPSTDLLPQENQNGDDQNV